MPRWQLHAPAIGPAKQSRRRVRRAFEEGRRDPDDQDAAEQGATVEILHRGRFTGRVLPKATPKPIVDRLVELCVAATSDPKVRRIPSTFVLEPALGFKETNALYQRELPVWMEAAQSLGLEPV